MNKLILFFCALLYSFLIEAQPTPLSDKDRKSFDSHYMIGAKEKLINNYDQAISEFKQCLQLDPANDVVYYNLAECYLRKKLYRDADEMIRKAIQLNNENSWYSKLQIEIFAASGDYVKAGELAEKLSAKVETVHFLYQAATYYELGEAYTKGLKVLSRIEKLTGQHEELLLRKEQLHLANKDWKNAVKEVKRLIALYPSKIKFKIILAELYLMNNQVKEGLALYQEVLKADPGNGYAAFALGDYYHQTGDLERWYEHTKKGMASKDVAIKDKLRMMVQFLSNPAFENQQERNMELCTILTNTHPQDPSVHILKGDMQASVKDYTGAHTSYESAIHADPGLFQAWEQLILAAEAIGDLKLLKHDCLEALEYFPTAVTFYYSLTTAAMRLKEYDSAIWSAKKAIEFESDGQPIEVQLYTLMGDAYQYLKRYEQSDSAYEMALKYDKENTYALNNYAYFLSLRKVKLELAKQMSLQTLAQEPKNGTYHDTYGWILYQLKEYEKAKEHIEKALQLEPGIPEVMEHLGDVYYQLGDSQKALELWRSAKEKGEGSPQLEKKINEKRLYE